MKRPLVSVIMPIYNELHNIKEIVRIVSEVPLDKEMILVDDCSSDGTREWLVTEMPKLYPDVRLCLHEVNRGKGASIRTGLSSARGEFVIIQDADLEYDPKDYGRLVAPLADGQGDVVYGSRFLNTIWVTNIFHYGVNWFITFLGNLLYGGHLTDLETCYKVIRRELMLELNLEADRFEIEAEITAKLLKRGIHILEVPVYYRGRNYQQGKKITWVDGVITVYVLFKLRWQNSLYRSRRP